MEVEVDTNIEETLESKNQKRLDEIERIRGLIEQHGKPKQKCRRCRGIGHLGKNITTNQYIICQCVVKRNLKWSK